MVVPAYQFHASVQVFHDRGAAVHPVAAVDIGQALDFLDHRPVDVAADRAVESQLACVADHRFFEVEDEIQRGLDAAFCVARQRPVAGALESAPHPRQVDVQPDQQVVGDVAEYRDPFVVARDLVELVAVHQQVAASVASGVDMFGYDHHVAERGADVFAHRLVVVARNEEHLFAVTGAAQQFLHEGVLLGRPVDPAAAHRPQIDDIAQQKQVFGRIAF